MVGRPNQHAINNFGIFQHSLFSLSPLYANSTLFFLFVSKVQDQIGVLYISPSVFLLVFCSLFFSETTQKDSIKRVSIKSALEVYEARSSSPHLHLMIYVFRQLTMSQMVDKKLAPIFFFNLVNRNCIYLFFFST